MIFWIVIGIIIILITNGFVLLEEELLIVLAGFIWVHAAGKLINNLLKQYLIDVGLIIKNKYLWFLLKKKEISIFLIRIYYKRMALIYLINDIQAFILINLINNSIIYFLNNSILLKKYNILLLLNNFGSILIKDIFMNEILVISNILIENKNYINSYTNVNYLNKNIGNFNNVAILTV